MEGKHINFEGRHHDNNHMMPPFHFCLLAHEGRFCIAGKGTRQILPQHLTSPSTLVRAASIARIGHDVRGEGADYSESSR